MGKVTGKYSACYVEYFKQYHICIMKKFRQHFTIAIITPTDGFTQISINLANQVSTQKPASSWQRVQNARDYSDTENSMVFFSGKALIGPLDTSANNYVGYRLLKYS